MSEDRTSSRTILTLGIALGLALLVIAFLLGRESNRILPDPDATVGQTPSTPPQERGQSPFSGVQVSDDFPKERIERRPDGTIVLSNRRDGEQKGEQAPPDPRATGAESPDAPEAVEVYFREVDAIRSGEEVGDPNAFAMGLLKAAMSGSTAGFDQLIADTKRMEEQMQSVAPPPSCQTYHAVNLEALAEGRAILEELKSALSTKNITKLKTVAEQAQNLERRANQLKEIENQIRPKRGLSPF